MWASVYYSNSLLDSNPPFKVSPSIIATLLPNTATLSFLFSIYQNVAYYIFRLVMLVVSFGRQELYQTEELLPDRSSLILSSVSCKRMYWAHVLSQRAWMTNPGSADLDEKTLTNRHCCLHFLWTSGKLVPNGCYCLVNIPVELKEEFFPQTTFKIENSAVVHHGNHCGTHHQSQNAHCGPGHLAYTIGGLGIPYGPPLTQVRSKKL